MPITPNEWYQKAIAPDFRRADEVRYMQMQHQSQQSPYQQFQSEYPAIDQYARDVVSGRRFAKTIHDTGTLMSQALDSPEAMNEAVGMFGVGGITKQASNKARQLGLTVKDDALDIGYYHNIEKNPFKKSQGEFGMQFEPAGQYLSHNPNVRTPSIDTMLHGSKQFKEPLFLKFGGGYAEKSNWKKALSEKYGLTGKKLTNKLRKEGYDGIVTYDERGQISEMVDLYKGKGGVDF